MEFILIWHEQVMHFLSQVKEFKSRANVVLGRHKEPGFFLFFYSITTSEELLSSWSQPDHRRLSHHVLVLEEKKKQGTNQFSFERVPT